jgi:drug/metabolite transporter (DMT)-like permease
MSRLRVWLAFALLSTVWGSSYLFIRVGVEQLTPVALVALRLVIGAIGLAVVAALRRADVRIAGRALAMVAIVATLYTTIPFLLITWGEQTVPSGLASVLNSTTPIFSILIAGAVLGDEPITLPRLGGIALGFIGVLLLVSRDLAHGGVHWSSIASQGAVVVASACYATSAVLTRRTLRGVSPLTVATYTVWIGAAETALLSLIFSPPPTASLHPKTVLAVVWLGLLGSALAYLLNFFIISRWGASRATLVTYVIPIVGLTLGAIFLGETLDWRILAGSALVIVGIALASLIKRPQPAAAALPQGAEAQRS